MHSRKIRSKHFDNIIYSDNCKVNYFFVFNMLRFFFELANFFRVFRVQKRIIFLRLSNPKLRLIALQCVYVKIDHVFENEFYFFAFLIFELYNKSFVVPVYIFDIKRSNRVVYFIFFKAFHIIPSSHKYFNLFLLVIKKICTKKPRISF